MRGIPGSVIILAILLGMLCSIPTVQKVEAGLVNGTIYIRADGSVDPPMSPIQRFGDNYTLTEDISASAFSDTYTLLVIQRSNLTVDAAGHSLKYEEAGYTLMLGGKSWGVSMAGVSNVTIRNMTIIDFYYCVSLTACSKITLSGNLLHTFTWTDHNHDLGGVDVLLDNSSDNTIIDNDMIDGVLPIGDSINNRIFHNNIAVLYNSWTKQMSGRNVWDDGYPSGGNYWSFHSIGGWDTEDIDIYRGPYQNETGSDGIVDTPVSLNQNNTDHYPLIIPRLRNPFPPVAKFHVWSSDPLHAGEPVNFDAVLSTPGWNGTDAMLIKEYRWDFGDGNVTSIFPPPSTVYPIVFHTYRFTGSFDVKLTVIDSDEVNSSTSTTVHVMMPTALSVSTNLPSSLVGYKVVISGRLSDAYGESLKNETVVVSYIFSGIKDWIPITSAATDPLGNYQAVWMPTATGSFTVKAEWAGNDTHLGTSDSTTLNSLTYENQYVFTVESNSTVLELAFNATSRELNFAVTGSDGTTGYAKVTVPKSLVADSKAVKAYLDSSPVTSSITSTTDSFVLTMSYLHSTHQLTINLGRAPASFIETPVGRLIAFGIPLAAIIAVTGFYVAKKRRKVH